MVADPRSWPSGEQVLALEAAVRRQGTGLDAMALQGCWQLRQLWPKGSRQPAPWAAALLRGLGARLEIEDNGGETLGIGNAVNLAGLELRFLGQGQLQGRRPLLVFHFEALELRCAGQRLWRQPLPPPAAGRRPFFALIARDPAGWLVARGRGGGLALWCLAPDRA